MLNNLATPFYKQAKNAPDRLALAFVDADITYGDLANTVRMFAAGIQQMVPSKNPRVGILAARNLEAYAGILAVLWAGGTYVPLNPKAPYPYLSKLIHFSDLDLIIVGNSELKLLTKQFLSEHSVPILAPLAEQSQIEGRPISGRDEISSLTLPITPTPVPPQAFAHLMFTSGTTGAPKGIAATVSNVHHFFKAFCERYTFTPEDRFAQYSNLDFEPIIIDFLLPLGIGASVHIIPEQRLLFPSEIIKEHELTVWYSLPYQINVMDQTGFLKPGTFPSLRLSLFVGEPLTEAAAAKWQKAAPNSIVENVYAPSEICGLCLGQPYGQKNVITPERGFVALGTAYPEMHVAIVDPSGLFLPIGNIGEIVISGPQVTPGYIKNPTLTKDKFKRLKHHQLGENIWYFTGDQGYQDPSGIFHFMGRLDHQVKILGYRVELEKVEFHLRELSGSNEVAAIPWPVVDNLIQGMVGFIGGKGFDPTTVKNAMRNNLPSYQIPKRIICLDNLPRNKNHKIDRKALRAQLEREDQ